MKKILYFFIGILLLGCNNSKEKETEALPEEDPDLVVVEANILALDPANHLALQDWISYYKALQRNFSIDDFMYEDTYPLEVMEGSVPGSFDREFDIRYSDFLVYNSDSTRYIDFDSYHWSLDANNQPLFSPDQEINVVNIPKKTVTRIGFRGPSYWVEDAFWKNDSVIVLLENSYEQKPVINMFI